MALKVGKVRLLNMTPKWSVPFKGFGAKWASAQQNGDAEIGSEVVYCPLILLAKVLKVQASLFLNP